MLFPLRLQVADELVAEFDELKRSDPSVKDGVRVCIFSRFCVIFRHVATFSPQSYDEKNIRRRVYDALNVLMSMDVISRDRKEIRWNGLPSSATEELSNLMVCVLWPSGFFRGQFWAVWVAAPRGNDPSQRREETGAFGGACIAGGRVSHSCMFLRSTWLICCSSAANRLPQACAAQPSHDGSSESPSGNSGGTSVTAAVYCCDNLGSDHNPVGNGRTSQVGATGTVFPLIPVGRLLLKGNGMCHRRDLFFNFSGPFEIHDDSEILRRLGFQNVRAIQLLLAVGCTSRGECGGRSHVLKLSP